MNIVLIGMRGSWKSSVGKILAQRLGFGLRETDAMVEEWTGQPIADFVTEYGWDAFREKEMEAVAGAAGERHVVISTGGGAILRKENVAALKSHGFIIFLYAPIEHLIERIQHSSKKRPLLTEVATFEEDMRMTWKEREPLYRAAADAIVDTVQKDSQSVAEEVLQLLKEHNVI